MSLPPLLVRRPRLLALAVLAAVAALAPAGAGAGGARTAAHPLSFGLGHDPSGAIVGRPVSISFSVANVSTETINALHATVKLPRALAIDSLSPGCGVSSAVTRTSTLIVDCAAGSLAPGAG